MIYADEVPMVEFQRVIVECDRLAGQLARLQEQARQVTAERDAALALLRRAEPFLRDYGRRLSNRYTGDSHPAVVDWLTEADALLAETAELRLTHQLAEDREQQAEEYRCLYDNARAWARLWKRAAIIERALPVRESTWCNRRWWCERFLDRTARTTFRVRDNLRRGLGLPAASATNAAASEGGA